VLKMKIRDGDDRVEPEPPRASAVRRPLLEKA
jgi:hypothetical protein